MFTPLIVTLSILLTLIILFVASYKKVKLGIAIVRKGWGKTKVSFESIFAIPFIHKTYKINITLQELYLEFKNEEALRDKEEGHIFLKAKIYFRISQNVDAIKQVINSIGTERTFDKEYLEFLFKDKFRETFKFITRHYHFEEILKNEDYYKKTLLEEFGTELYGYSLEDVIFEKIEKA